MEVDGDFERHQPVEIGFEKSQILPDGVAFFEVVHHVTGGLHLCDSDETQNHGREGECVNDVPAVHNKVDNAVDNLIDESIVQMARLFVVGHGQIAEHGRNQYQTDNEDGGNADEGNQTEFFQNLAGSNDECSESCCGGQIGQ